MISNTASANKEYSQRFDRIFAENVADEIITKLQNHFVKYQICGSLRRMRDTVGDIDIVAIPKCAYEPGDETLSESISKIDPNGSNIVKSLGKSGAGRFLDGDLVKRFHFQGILIDLYLADETTFGTLVLIRTGSKEHNIKLAMIARSKNMKLFASGKGLCRVDSDDNITEIICTDEHEILTTLLNNIPKPKERD